MGNRTAGLNCLRYLVAFCPGFGTAMVWMGILLWQKHSPPLLALPKSPIIPILIIFCLFISVAAGWYDALLNPNFPKTEGELKKPDLIRWIVVSSICQVVVIAPIVFATTALVVGFFLA
jgi:hypothetical protein